MPLFGTCIISILILKLDGSKPLNITVTRNNTVFDIIKYLLLKSHTCTCIMCFTRGHKIVYMTYKG